MQQGDNPKCTPKCVMHPSSLRGINLNFWNVLKFWIIEARHQKTSDTNFVLLASLSSFASLAAPEVVIVTTSGAANDDKIWTMATRCKYIV